MSTIDINEIKVRPATSPHDIDDVETALSRYHPLGYKRAIGARMFYLAMHRGDIVAVMIFDAPSDFNRKRDSEIGWSTEQCKQRRKHIANNSRFLVGKRYQNIPNLASKVLSLAADRISQDWMRRYGVPLLALETYVDPEYNDNHGTCYIAAGWKRLGLSTGYQEQGKERTRGKWYFLKSLNPKSYEALSSELPHALLTGVKEVSGKSNSNFVFDATKLSVKDLQKALTSVSDPRTTQGTRYRFLPLLSLCIAAVLSGYTQYRQIADWIRKLPAPQRVRFGMRGDRVPSEGTIGSLLRRIDPEQLSKALTEYLKKTYPRRDDYKFIIVDGKSLRGTDSVASKQVGFLNVFASELGIVVDQIPCQKGGGEKVAARKFLDKCEDLEGKIVLADAIHTDSNFIAALSKKKPISSSP
jgi:hypothetical protein